MKHLLLVLLIVLPFNTAECADNRRASTQLAMMALAASNDGDQMMLAGQYEKAEMKYKDAYAFLYKQYEAIVADSSMSNELKVSQLKTNGIAALGNKLQMSNAMFYQQKFQDAVGAASDVVDAYKNGGCDDDRCRVFALEASRLVNNIMLDHSGRGRDVAEFIIELASWAIDHINTKSDSGDMQRELYLQRATAYSGLEKFTQALADIDWILKHSPKEESWPAYGLKCDIHLQKKEYKSVNQCADKLISEFPKTSMPYVFKGRAQIGLGNNNGIEYCKKALELHPEDEDAKDCLASANGKK